MDTLQLEIENASSPAPQQLVAELDQELMARYPGLPVNGIDAVNFEASGGVFVVGYVDGEPAACGAFRRFEDAAEIKRMYVAPAHRGRGFGQAVLALLEAEAARRGFTRALLETGVRQVEAIALYRSAGWCATAPFGPYIGSPISVCFEKRLTPPD
jgi:GNAT superfamily N-acetyltransferase